MRHLHSTIDHSHPLPSYNLPALALVISRLEKQWITLNVQT